MDPIHHEKIADYLMQYWGKLPEPSNRLHSSMQKKIHIVNLRIEDLLKSIDELAICIEEGLIR